MLEREGLVAAETSLLERVRGGDGTTLAVMGEAGLGKTIALEHARSMAESAGMRVGVGSGDAMETWLPFGLIAQALDALGGPSLLQPAHHQQSGADARVAGFYSVLRWLEGLSSPMLLAVDDLHWADADSLALLAYICRRLRGRPIGVLMTMRPWPTQALEVASDLAGAELATLNRLEPLSTSAAAEVLTRNVEGPLPPEVIESASALAGGNPLLLVQLAAAASRGEELGRAASVGRPPPASHLLLARFARFPSSALRCAQAAATLGMSFRASVVGEVAQLEGAELERALDALCRSGLLRGAGDETLAFAHALVRQAIHDDLAAPVRTALHSRAFRVLAGRGLQAEAAEHALQAGLVGDGEAIAACALVGLEAYRRGALGSAARFLGAAVRFSEPRSRPDLLLPLGHSLLALGQVEDALSAYARVSSEAAASVPDRSEALRSQARVLSVTGQHEAAAGRFAEATEQAEQDHPDLAADVLLDQAMVGWYTSGPAHSLPLVARAREVAAAAGSPELGRRIEAVSGFLSLHAGDPAGIECVRRAGAVVAGDPLGNVQELVWPWGALTLSALTETMLEHFSDAERDFAVASEAVERLGAGGVLTSLLIAHAWLRARRGHLDDALAMLQRCETLLDLAPVNRAWVFVGQAYVLLQVGRLEEAESRWREARTLALAQGNRNAMLFVLDIQGQRCLREGRLDEAGGIYRELAASARQMGIGEPCLIAGARHAIDALVRSGNPDEASALLDRLERQSARLACRWPAMVCLTGRGWLLAQRGDHDGAEQRFAAALQLHEEVELPLEQVETLLAYGGFLRRRGIQVRARRLLGEALSLAEAMGAGWLASIAAEELAVAGGRRRRGSSSGGALTPSESRVARLAAEGLSNNQIAARLNVAPATVETHLQRTYAKLGIASRRQLMAMAAAGRPLVPR